MPDGTTEMEVAGVRIVLEQGTPIGARGVAVRGIEKVTDAVAELGVWGDERPNAGRPS